MNKPEFVKRLRELVGQGNVQEALDLLNYNDNEFASPFSNDILMLKGQYHSAKNQFIINGIIENLDYNLIVSRISLAILDLVDKIEKKSDRFKHASYGQVLHRIPSKMCIKRETKCIIRIAYDFNSLIKKIIIDDETNFESIQISEIMNVELIDTNEVKIFKIRTCTEEEQFIIHDDFTQWIFFVQPMIQGRFPLLLKIDVIEEINEKKRKRNIIFEKEINIEAQDVNQGESQFQITNIRFEDNKFINNALSNTSNINQLVFDPQTGEFVITSGNLFNTDRETINSIAMDGFACFLKGTKVLVNYKDVNTIENLKIGDKVLTKLNISNELCIQKIINISIRMTNEYIVINNLLRTTSTELIMTKQGFRRVMDLKLSDFIESFEFDFIPIYSIKAVKENVKVFNLEFERDCSFYAEGFLVGDLISKKE